MKNVTAHRIVGVVACGGALFGSSVDVTAELIDVSAVSGAAERYLIDFESGFTDTQAIGVINAGGVDVTVGTLSPGGGAYVAEVGGDVTGFAPGDRPAGGVGGNFFVSDEPDGLSDRFDYTVSFSQEVSNVTLDGYDFRSDGGGRVGDTVTLNAYNAMNQLIGSDVYTITGAEPDGNVVSFGVGQAGIRRVELVSSGADVGTGIDNIGFEIGVAAAPEPAEWAMLGLGSLLLLAAGRRRREPSRPREAG